tara:strand:+ start:1219 stop:1416 length:198 start_codon:yes stop_codon:yes gene_type:complete
MKLTPQLLDELIKNCMRENGHLLSSLNESRSQKEPTKLTPQLLKKLLKEQLEKQTYEWVLLPPPS